MFRNKRIILLIVLPLFAACQTLETVDKGLYEVNEKITERDTLTGRRTISLEDRAGQERIGNQAAEKIISEGKSQGIQFNEDVDPDAYARIKEIFNRLHSVSHVRTEEWTPVLIESNEWNAFTTGGTYFFINSQLEKDLQDDNELANVIAHEMAHTVANHAFEKASYMKLNALVRSKSAKRSSFGSAFTHEQEEEADRVGILYCALAGYDPYAGQRIWERQKAEKGDSAIYISDHPINSERALSAKLVADKVSQYYDYNRVNPDFESILKENSLFTYEESKPENAGKGGGLASVLDTALQTYSQRMKVKAEEERLARRTRFMQSVNRVSKIVGSKPIDENAWRITVKYQGNLRLHKLSFKMTVMRPGSIPVVSIKEINGILNPNTTFDVDFTNPDLNTALIKQEWIVFSYDYAEPL